MKTDYDCYINTVNTDYNIQLIHCGIENRLSHCCKPNIINRFVLQYIIKGKGTLILNGKTFTIKKGDLFYIPEGYLCSYYSSHDDPYVYYYVAFTGSGSKILMSKIGFDLDKPIIKIDNPEIEILFAQLFDSFKEDNFYYSTLSQSIFYRFISEISKGNPDNLVSETKSIHRYIALVKDYIRVNYAHDFSVQELSNHIWLNRSYLSSLFRQSQKMSLIDYIIDYRLSKATLMLKNTNLTVSEISLYTGFKSPQNFYIRFKQRFGISPKYYRKHNTNR